ncbi:four-carbon acid sugar kinase family protein [Candidatus Bathyarchaeota archaeon]|nr:four-carbon acid sugar kinase family protein [Candidatus Bathyarchaeota archaeon]
MPSDRLGVVADDLTGACDTALQFAKCGLETLVVKDFRSAPKALRKVDVVVVTTESRGDPPERAYRKVREAVKSLKDAGVSLFYKKVDSTLRGNIASELKAMLDELDLEVAVFSPVFPDNHRVMVGGYYLVDGNILQGGLGSFAPIYVPEMVRKNSELDVAHLNISKVREGGLSLRREIGQKAKSGVRIIVIDAVTYGDLQAIAEAVSSETDRWLPCGSAGLAEAIPEAYGLIRRLGVLVVSGSTSPVSMSQIRFAEKTLGVKVIKLDLKAVTERPEVEVERVFRESKVPLAEGIPVIVTSAVAQSDVMDRSRRLPGNLDVSELKGRIASFLGAVARRVLESSRVSGLVLTGGDVAIKALEALDVERLRVEDEVLPGVPSTRVMDGKFRGLRVVTKAGGFGEENSLVKIIKYLRSR